MPAIFAEKIKYEFFKNSRVLSDFLHEAKLINFEKGFISKNEFANLCTKFGIPKSTGYSILSFYKLISFDKPQEYYCQGSVCNRKNPFKGSKIPIHCLGRCDNPPAYFDFLSKNEEKVKILGESELLAPLDIDECSKFFEEIISRDKTETLRLIKKSNLKGRGGAGFPAWRKIETLISIDNPQKYLVCNADESAPFVFKDRALMEHNPVSVIFGLYTLCHLIECEKIFVYIRGEYKTQKESLISAYMKLYHRLRKYGLPEIEFVSGAGAYVCGEETALFESLEGKRGEPRKKPPFPFEKGLFGKPTLINNVETVARIFFISAGKLEFGQKMLYSLSGDINKSGVFEDYCEISVKKAVENYGNGLADNKNFGFACIGGASGGFVGKKDYEKKLKDFGVGAFFISHDERDPKDVLEYILRFLSEESCGKCLTCANGYLTILKMIQSAQIDKKRVSEIVFSMEKSNLCGLGKAVVKPLESFFEIIGDKK